MKPTQLSNVSFGNDSDLEAVLMDKELTIGDREIRNVILFILAANLLILGAVVAVAKYLSF